MDKFIDFLSDLVELDEIEKEYIHQNLTLKTVKKRQHLLRQGEVSKAFYFICEGCVRLYYEVGIEERTAYFYVENEFVSAYESFTQQVPCSQNIQAIEDLVVVEISVDQSVKLLSKFPKFEFLARVMMERELIANQKIIASFVNHSPEMRYLKLQKENPELLERVPQYYLASFIGVQPESLSRIRKRASLSHIS